MLALYHFSGSTCSQKVRLVLAEKELEYESRDVNLMTGGQHDPEYVKLNPNHVVPTLLHDDRAFIESTLINEYLDEAFADRPLRPADPGGRHAMRLWTARIDHLHPNAGVLTYGIGTRPMVLQRGPEEIEALLAEIPNPAQRERRRATIEQGVKAPFFKDSVQAFVRVLDQMQSDLEGRTWLAGDVYTLADAAALPYVLRLDHLAMTPLIEARPRVADWYDRVRSRKSYEVAITAQLPPPLIEMFRKNGEAVWNDIEPQTQLD